MRLRIIFCIILMLTITGCQLETDTLKKNDAEVAQTDIANKKPLENSYPCCVMYNNELYVHNYYTWSGSLDEIGKAEKVGVVESSVSINNLPTVNYQTNAIGFVGKTIWLLDGKLAIDPDGDEMNRYWFFEKAE